MRERIHTRASERAEVQRPQRRGVAPGKINLTARRGERRRAGEREASDSMPAIFSRAAAAAAVPRPIATLLLFERCVMRSKR